MGFAQAVIGLVAWPVQQAITECTGTFGNGIRITVMQAQLDASATPIFL